MSELTNKEQWVEEKYWMLKLKMGGVGDKEVKGSFIYCVKKDLNSPALHLQGSV